MEQLIKNFGELLGMQDLSLPSTQFLRLEMENLGDLDLFYQEERLLMRLTKSVPFVDKDICLNLLAATNYRQNSPHPMRPYVQKPDRVGFCLIFPEQSTPNELYKGLELLTSELRKRCP